MVVVVVVGDIPMLILGVSSLLVSHWALSPSTVPWRYSTTRKQPSQARLLVSPFLDFYHFLSCIWTVTNQPIRINQPTHSNQTPTLP